MIFIDPHTDALPAERRIAHDMLSYRREVDALLVEFGVDVLDLDGCALSASEVEAIREWTDPGHTRIR